ncbi:FMN adenylyltransferase/Riboflavin kinase [Citrifermentans bremense]|uniref:Riboflavin biosynthesis protein n=1 Tax=Citrifermentans bremense TaxID=60035 RepID=A0A6S6LY10_9BACT|nr:bifunctional riboflavin kinase/FAD synthetase [Citrifermentans bremense]BCG46902.1 FMN adenylyltransferase/Riboflavin kinase [Citrifermentans bremense]
MVIFRSISDIKEKLRHPAVTIGNFDGVHLGHREIFRRVRERAEEMGGVSVVVTFVPHPLKVVPSHKEVRLITTRREKEFLIESAGIDYLLEIPFDREFAAVSAADFVQKVLVDAIGVERLVIGYDYAFGRGREGDVQLLREMGKRHGYSVEVLEPISNGATVYSSTKVRGMVSAGDVEGVVGVLGRHYAITGTVVHGHQRGRGLGFPTANLATEKDLLPAGGVYAVKVCIGSELLDGACNIGTNPTFGDGSLSLEVFLFDVDRDLYGREITVFFIARLREERRFDGLEALKEQIALDVTRCREILEDAEPVGAGDWGPLKCSK